MQEPVQNALRTIVHDRLRLQEPLSRHTTLRIGGPADYLADVHGVEELKEILRVVREGALPLAILGNGSNLLVADEGVRGLVLKLGGELARMAIAGTRVRAGGGYNLPKLALELARAGLAGLEFGCSIPGTLGAGVAINAGAHGSDMSHVVAEARVIWPDGRDEWVPHAAVGFAYRHTRLLESGAVVVEAVLQLSPGDPVRGEAMIRSFMERRRATQPQQIPNCGSVFANPPGDYAGRLIEAAGLKGLRHGGAQISEKHANFIVNLGGASFADVIFLMQTARNRVQERFGTLLRPEVRIWGPNPFLTSSLTS